MNKDCTTCVEIPADDAPVCQVHGYPMEVGAGFACDKYRERVPASDPEEDAAELHRQEYPAEAGKLVFGDKVKVSETGLAWHEAVYLYPTSEHGANYHAVVLEGGRLTIWPRCRKENW